MNIDPSESISVAQKGDYLGLRSYFILDLFLSLTFTSRFFFFFGEVAQWEAEVETRVKLND